MNAAPARQPETSQEAKDQRPVRIVAGDAVGQWVASRVKGRYWPAMSRAIGLERGGALVAGVIYEQWNGRSVTCHIAIDARLTAAYVAAIFDFPFRAMGAGKILAPVASANTRSRRLVERMGFAVEATITDAHPDGDLLIYSLKRRDCRFLGEQYGKRLIAATGA